RAESQPVAGMMMAFAARNEVMTHDISSMPAESEPCMCGRATLVTLESSTCMTVTIMTENVMAHRRAGGICPSVAVAAELTHTHYVITALDRTPPPFALLTSFCPLTRTPRPPHPSHPRP